jgi:hypothetical protein
MFQYINMWAVVGAAVANMVLGFLWFGPVFGKVWGRLGNRPMPNPSEMTSAMKRKMRWNYFLLLIGSFLMSFTLASLITMHNAYYFTSGIMSAVAVGVFLWIGLVLPITMGVVLWEGKSWKYWMITYGFYLVSFIVMGAILSVWM